ncbi:MAG: MoaD/ThiS family protein [Candidatus Heimdallarchaeaceae archaeon]
MNIRLKLYASLRKHIPGTEIGEEVKIEVEQESTIMDILDRYKIEEKLAKIIFVNGVHKKVDYVLQENDLLVVFPPIGGG